MNSRRKILDVMFCVEYDDAVLYVEQNADDDLERESEASVRPAGPDTPVDGNLGLAAAPQD